MLNFYNQSLSYQTHQTLLQTLLEIMCKPFNSLNKCSELLVYEDVIENAANHPPSRVKPNKCSLSIVEIASFDWNTSRVRSSIQQNLQCDTT